jgi:hypothetical protein
MTTFVADTRTTATLRRPAVAGRLAAARAWAQDWHHAFRAAAAAPRREGMDPTALALFGRD